VGEYRELAASWDNPGGEVTYEIVEDEAVEPDVRRAALAGRELACAHLRVARPMLRFYVPEGAAHRAYRKRYGMADWLSFKAPMRNGHADRSTRSIGVRADIGPELAAEVAAHEVFHLTQADRDRESEEAEAYAYGEWAASVLARRGKVANVHRQDGHPYHFSTLSGVAEPDDVLLARDEGRVGVYRNLGSKARPYWVEHHADCPVPIGAAA
jgi:hypothetical protein